MTCSVAKAFKIFQRCRRQRATSRLSPVDESFLAVPDCKVFNLHRNGGHVTLDPAIIFCAEFVFDNIEDVTDYANDRDRSLALPDQIQPIKSLVNLAENFEVRKLFALGDVRPARTQDDTPADCHRKLKEKIQQENVGLAQRNEAPSARTKGFPGAASDCESVPRRHYSSGATAANIIPLPSVVGTPDGSRVGGASIAPLRAAGTVLIPLPDFSEPLEVYL